jgi:uncharacterized protein Smg (DUF494 family)
VEIQERKRKEISVQGSVEEIITYMTDKFRTYEVFENQLKRITRELIERGYTLEEITKGINAYLLQLEPQSTDSGHREKIPGRERTFRVLDREESRRIAPKAFGYLLLLREMGMLSAEETEEIIHYITGSGMHVETGDEVQMVMLELLLESESGQGEREGDTPAAGKIELGISGWQKLLRRHLN